MKIADFLLNNFTSNSNSKKDMKNNLINFESELNKIKNKEDCKDNKQKNYRLQNVKSDQNSKANKLQKNYYDKNKINNSNDSNQYKTNDNKAVNNSKINSKDDKYSTFDLDFDEKNDDTEINSFNDLIIFNISNILNIPEENIKTSLEELDISILDLNDKENISNFLQKVFNLNENVELLSIPNISEKLNSISELILSSNEIVSNNYLQEENNNILDINKSINNVINLQNTNKPEFYKLNDKIEENINNYDDNDDISILNNIDDINLKVDKKDNQKDSSLDHNSKSFNQKYSENNNVLINNPDLMKNSKVNFIEQLYNESNSQIQIENNSISSNINKSINNLKENIIRNIDNQDIIDQILEKTKINIKGEMSEIKIKVKPEDLGDITLKVATQNGIVTAKFIAENQKIKEIIESNLNILKDSLSEQGLNISQLSVSVGNDEAKDRMQEFIMEQKKSSTRIQKIIEDISLEENKSVDNSVKPSDIYENNVDYIV